MGRQVHFIDEDHIGALENGGIFQWLVVAVGNCGHGDAQMLAQIILGGADQIADVLHDDGIDAAQVQQIDGPADHIRLQVAGALGIELDRPCAQPGQTGCILGSIQVALDDGDAGSFQRAAFQELFHQGGLSAAGGAQQMDHADAHAA